MSGDFRDGVPPLAALAAQALGWPPEAFWHATPAELATALGPIAATGEGMTRADLEHLMKAAPDD